MACTVLLQCVLHTHMYLFSDGKYVLNLLTVSFWWRVIFAIGCTLLHFWFLYFSETLSIWWSSSSSWSSPPSGSCTSPRLCQSTSVSAKSSWPAAAYLTTFTRWGWTSLWRLFRALLWGFIWGIRPWCQPGWPRGACSTAGSDDPRSWKRESCARGGGGGNIPSRGCPPHPRW